MRSNRAVAAAMLLACATTGCSRPVKTDTRFDVNKWLFGTIRGADRVTLYEGLPHQLFEGNVLEGEKRSKATVALHGFSFYARPLDLKDADRPKLTDLLGAEESYAPLPDGAKACGGFHPDYCVEWATGEDVYRCLVCFGCGEVKVFGPGAELHSELVARDALKRLLTPYWKNRPASEIWPPRASAAEPDGAPDRGGEK